MGKTNLRRLLAAETVGILFILDYESFVVTDLCVWVCFLFDDVFRAPLASPSSDMTEKLGLALSKLHAMPFQKLRNYDAFADMLGKLNDNHEQVSLAIAEVKFTEEGSVKQGFHCLFI